MKLTCLRPVFPTPLRLKHLPHRLSSTQNTQISASTTYNRQADRQTLLAHKARHIQRWRMQHGPNRTERLFPFVSTVLTYIPPATTMGSKKRGFRRKKYGKGNSPHPPYTPTPPAPPQAHSAQPPHRTPPQSHPTPASALHTHHTPP